jgi:hypothetical protein
MFEMESKILTITLFLVIVVFETIILGVGGPW